MMRRAEELRSYSGSVVGLLRLKRAVRQVTKSWGLAQETSLPRFRAAKNVEGLEPRLLLAGNVVINEIHYDPNIETEQVEFVELTNSGDAPMNLGGATFTSGITYTFPAGTTLVPGAFIVVASFPAEVQAKFGITAMGPFTGKLSNEGEKLTLKDAGGTTLDEVTYGVGFPWPITGDLGNSIELINPTFDNTVPGHWRAASINSTSLIPTASNWRYRKGVNEPPANWMAPAFNEASDPTTWQTGKTSIGFGDGDDSTILSDMQNNYNTVYLRNTFSLSGTLPTALTLRLYVDDGAIVYINNVEVIRAHVTSGIKTYTSTGQNHEAAWETFNLANVAGILNQGTNTIAIHVMNQAIDSSDLSIDAELTIPAGGGAGGPTPRAQNSAFATSTPPLMSDLTQSVQQPVAGQAVTITIKATDPQGVQSVNLEYQLVNPGAYIRLSDAAYTTNWTALPMHDDGVNGDAVAGDGVYSVVVPGSLQTHRRLVRYRVAASDTTGASIRAPYADDTQPNFAYYVYNGIPSWTGANQPGVTSPQTFGTDITNGGMATYHLIANSTDVNNSQYVSSSNGARFYGTLVYDGVVYDDITFANRGEVSTYVSGKNKWRVNFNTGHEFAARDNYGQLYQEKWRRLTLNANAEPWLTAFRGLAGLEESVSHKLFQLAGVPSPNTNYIQFRVVDDALESTADQYTGDMWGLYLAVEYTGGRWLDQHGLEDGNVYEIEASGPDARNLAPGMPSDGSDWVALRDQGTTSAPLSFWQQNVNLDEFFSFQSINRVTSNVDLRSNANFVMYHAPDGKWQAIPWDLDMMYVPRTHHAGQIPLSNMFTNAQLKMEYANRARELMDLLFSDSSRTGGQVAQVVDEYARFINKSNGAGGYSTGWAELDQFLWNYHPRTTADHKGTFYLNPASAVNRGGTWTRTLDTADFKGMTQYLINFMTNTDPDGWAINDGDQRGYGFNYLRFEAQDALIPNRPTTTYIGPANFPLNQLKFSTSAFSDPNGSAFAAMEWRLGEISNPGTPGFDPNKPWKYEINSIWESGELTTYGSQITVPAGVIQAGHTYRLRVRMKDATGRWSSWSNVAVGGTEFVAGASVDPLQSSLRITEINYNPGAGDEADPFEFVEFKNIGTDVLQLSGVQFTTGIQGVFNNVSLNPGELGVFVKSISGFQSRYGTDIKILGTYADGGKLDNGGEKLILKDSAGNTLEDFIYDDTGAGWHPSTDGAGATLVVINPLVDPLLGQGSSWRPSLKTLGTPGVDETIPHVASVQVGGSSWAGGFVNFMNSTGLGNDGFAVAAGASQTLPLPWSNINRIRIGFDQNVVVNSGDLVISGVNVANYLIASFTYDPATLTAVWTLSAAIAADRLTISLSDSVHNVLAGAPNVALDGDWNNKPKFPSGNGFAGGGFIFNMNVLPGDVNRNGVVQADDGLAVRAALGTTPEQAAYSIYADLNANGVVQSNDGLLARALLGTSLPAAPIPAGTVVTPPQPKPGRTPTAPPPKAMPVITTKITVPVITITTAAKKSTVAKSTAPIKPRNIVPAKPNKAPVDQKKKSSSIQSALRVAGLDSSTDDDLFEPVYKKTTSVKTKTLAKR